MKANVHATNPEHITSLPQGGSTLKQRIAGIAGTVREGSGGPSFNQVVLPTGSRLLQNRKRVDMSSNNVVVEVIGLVWKQAAFTVQSIF